MDLRFSQLEISGAQGLIPNRFWKQPSSDHLTVVFPGAGYTCLAPLLYYSSTVMLAKRSDVLQVNYNYGDEFRNLTDVEQEALLRAEGMSALRAGLKQRSYSKLTLIGKSLGTRVLAQLFLQAKLWPYAPDSVNSLWLTPLLERADVFSGMIEARGSRLCVVGENDKPCFIPDRLDLIDNHPEARVIAVPDADHSLDVANDIFSSLNALKIVVAALDTLPFVGKD